MKNLSLTIFILIGSITGLFSQTTTVASNYKHIRVNTAGHGTYKKALILLHPIYDGTDLANNYVVGHIVARRGAATALNRLDVAYINSSSAYRTVAANIVSNNTTVQAWALKTCMYNGGKYLALDIPYTPSYHSQGIEFAGWALSSGESFKFLIYENNGVPENTTQLTDIQDYVPNMDAIHAVRNFNVLGNVGIGTTDPKAKLAVNGNILAKEIKVKTDITVPDYVFEPEYELTSLSDIEAYVKEHKHLPEIPSAKDIERDGLDLAEMNLLLLKKVEELTLHLIEQDKAIDAQNENMKGMKKDMEEMKVLLGILP